MLSLLFGVITRIFSNSFLNAFQKMLTVRGEKSSVINFYTYLGLTLLCIPFLRYINITGELIYSVIFMGGLGAIGNYYIIKALSCGELSSLAPINSYKPIVALIIGIFILNEMPTLKALSGILFIIIGTIILFEKNKIEARALFYRIIALILSGTEAIFIKKVIMLSDINSALFFWALSGFIFSLLLVSKHSLKISKGNIKYQLALITSVFIMQFFTNYVFSKMNVAYALALFQLSTLLSIFIGVNVFKEKDLLKKIAAALVMIFGAIIILLN